MKISRSQTQQNLFVPIKASTNSSLTHKKRTSRRRLSKKVILMSSLILLLPGAALAGQYINDPLPAKSTGSQLPDQVTGLADPSPSDPTNNSDDLEQKAAPEPPSESGATHPTSSSNRSSSSVSLSVNGQPVSIPPNGAVRKQINTSNSRTSIGVSVDSSGIEVSGGNSSTKIDIHSHTQSIGDTTKQVRGRTIIRQR